jgi:hypothetical protein
MPTIIVANHNQLVVNRAGSVSTLRRIIRQPSIEARDAHPAAGATLTLAEGRPLPDGQPGVAALEPLAGEDVRAADMSAEQADGWHPAGALVARGVRVGRRPAAPARSPRYPNPHGYVPERQEGGRSAIPLGLPRSRWA